MFDSYYYAIRQKELLIKSIWAKLRRLKELQSLIKWAKKKNLAEMEQKYRCQLQELEDKLFWQTREHRTLLETCRWGLEFYNQIVPSPKANKATGTSKYAHNKNKSSRKSQYRAQPQANPGFFGLAA